VTFPIDGIELAESSSVTWPTATQA